MIETTLESLNRDDTPDRALPFLRAIATRVEIRAAMLAAGYTEEEQAHGWKLLLEAAGYVATPLPQIDDQKARAAITELDAWDEPGFRRIHAALSRLHPEQDAFVFAGLEPAQGIGAIVTVATLLDRLDALESSPDRAATREADKAALATLAQRGIDRTIRERLAELVLIAQSARAPEVPEPAPTTAARDAALLELRAWYRDWSETARAVIRRRDLLVLMGLARRRSPKQKDAPVPAPVPTTPTTPAPIPGSENGAAAAFA